MKSDENEIQRSLNALRDGSHNEKVVARVDLARIFEQRGMLSEAIELLETNARLGVQTAAANSRLARLYQANGNEQAAAHAANEASKLMAEQVRVMEPSRAETIVTQPVSVSRANIVKRLFSGRLNAKNYMLGHVIFLFVLLLMLNIMTWVIDLVGIRELRDLGIILPLIVYYLYHISFVIRRLHDCGRSGWSILLTLVPILGQLIFLRLLFPGDHGENEYGESTEGSISLRETFAIQRSSRGLINRRVAGVREPAGGIG